MSVAELQKFTAVSKYARYVKELSRRETWSETSHRWADGISQKYPHRADRIRQLAEDYIVPMRVLPSMRAMQFGGPPLFRHEARCYNCSSSYIDRLSFFGQAFYLLLCGAGVGYSVQERHISSLPNFSQARQSRRRLPKKTWKVKDSITGWAECAHVQLSSYHERPVPGYEEWQDCDVEFDYSDVSPAGTPLSYGVGVAPGPRGLAKSLARNRLLLEHALDLGMSRFNDEFASDYHLNNSDAVVSGGIRRSANIGIFDRSSERMVNYKTGDWRTKHPQRARANMSAMLVRGEVSFDEFQSLFGATRQFGEPGFYWSFDPDVLPNPCAEILFYLRLLLHGNSPLLPVLLKNYDGPVKRYGEQVGLSGFQMCNLTTINGRLVRCEDDFREMAAVASEFGTYQAGFNHFPFLGEITELIVKREALLGVSVCGMMHNPPVMLNPDVLRRAATEVVRVNEEVAAAIGINAAARTTCVKPDGNSSATLGSFSGCHPGKIRRGFRVVQVNRREAPYQHFKAANPDACEESVWSTHKTDDCVRFCVEYDGLLEDDMSAIEFLEHVRTIQTSWVEAGTVPERCVKPYLRHNVSNTCFSARTKFVTDQGVCSFEDFRDGQAVNVLNCYGRFVPAVVKNFGRQKIWELTVSDGKNQRVIETTGNHIWLLVSKNAKSGRTRPIGTHLGYQMVTTSRLCEVKSRLIPKLFAKLDLGKVNPEAYCHGFVFGDGGKHYAKENSRTHVSIFDACKRELAAYFAANIPGCSVIDHGDYVYVGKLNPKWKELPETTDPLYLFSFIAGWFAADGYITSIHDNQRAVSIVNKDRANMEWLVKVAQAAGIGVGDVKLTTQTTGYNPGTQYYRVNLVKSTLCDEFFINHKDKYERWLEQKQRTQSSKYWKVVSCQETDREEEVWCVVEPVTSTFVLEGGVLTHNCRVREHEWGGVAQHIFRHQNDYGGVTFISVTGDRDYAQAPFTPVFLPHELEAMYTAGGVEAARTLVEAAPTKPSHLLWEWCEVALGIAPATPESTAWADQLTAAAGDLFGGDVKRMTYAVKDVFNHGLWELLREKYRPVDYAEMVEETSGVQFAGEAACAGGACEA